MDCMNFYPEQLRQIADMLDAMNRAEGIAMPENGMGFMISTGIPIESEEGDVVGHFVDEVGGAWSFRPCPLKR